MDRRLSPALIIVVGTVVSYAIGFGLGVPALMPFLNAVPAIPLMYQSIRDGRVKQGVGRMLLWAVVMGVSATAISWAWPDASGRLFLNGNAYRQEMFEWVRTGVGAESSPALFLPNHAKHAAIFSVLSLATGSVLSMPMGAALMNYMGHFVGALTAASTHPWIVVLMAWVPWSLVRIVSFVTLGVVLAGPVMSRVGGFSFHLKDHRRLILLAVGGLLVDVTMKALLAPAWQTMLKRAAGF